MWTDKTDIQTYGWIKQQKTTHALEKETTRRVLSETKAIMSPPVCHWMESKFVVEEGEIVI